MIAYHEANPDTVSSILQKGLQKTSRGDLSNHAIRAQTDRLLDDNRPEALRLAGLSRDNNVYAFLYMDGTLTGIDKGEPLTVEEYVRNTDQAVFCLTIDPTRTYVSDLDAYDSVAKLLQTGADEQTIAAAARRYWSTIIQLSSYEAGQIKRPELMITYDIPPGYLTCINKG